MSVCVCNFYLVFERQSVGENSREKNKQKEYDCEVCVCVRTNISSPASDAGIGQSVMSKQTQCPPQANESSFIWGQKEVGATLWSFR